MKAETPADSPTTSSRSWSNSEAAGLSRCRTGFFGGLNQIGREMVLGPGSPWGPRLTAATASPPRSQAAEGLHYNIFLLAKLYSIHVTFFALKIQSDYF